VIPRRFLAGLLVALPSAGWAQLPAGAEFIVNSYTTSVQFRPSVSSDASGDFVVVWASDGQDGSVYGVFGRRFNASGTPQGSEFRVNSFTTSYQGRPAVASAPNGDFVVVWRSDGQDGPSSGIFGKRFNASGVPQSGEFRINSYTTGDQVSPSVAADAAGNFVVVWVSGGQDGSGYGIFGQRFNAAAVALGAEFRVNSYTTGAQNHAHVTSDEHGNFAVVWVSSGQDGSGDGVFGQRFDSAGLPQGGEFRVNSFTNYFQYAPALAASPDGDFLVVWQSFLRDGDLFGLAGQRYGDMIFEDGFESGGLSRWSSATTDGGNLGVSGAAAMAGTTTGLQAFVNDTNSLFVQDDTPNAESRYRVRFYFDPNGYDPGEALSHFRTRIFIASDESSLRIATIVLKRQVGAYSVEARVRRNDGTRADTGFFPITDGPHFIELDWQGATGPGASDGSLQLWIDDAPVSTLTGIDNDQNKVGFARLGALAIKTGAGGTLYFDQFESRRDRFIGAE
jgi:hypothetical protein